MKWVDYFEIFFFVILRILQQHSLNLKNSYKSFKKLKTEGYGTATASEVGAAMTGGAAGGAAKVDRAIRGGATTTKALRNSPYTIF